MHFTLGLKKLPFVPDRSQIIYVADEKDEKVTQLIQDNFYTIRDYFESRHYTFCYIPYVKRALLTGDRLHYNVPFAKTSREAEYMVSDNFILDYMIHPENREKVTPCLLYYHPDCVKHDYKEAEDQLLGVTISESSFDNDPELKGALNEILDNIDKHCIRFSIKDERDFVCEEEPQNPDFADEQFDVESRLLIREIEERIEKLRSKGIETYMLDSMKLHYRKSALSRMHITKDYRIFLNDYFGMEIYMTPLPKAVYLLFLRHPEGIIFKHLPDYQQELREIYSRIKPSYGTIASLQSIEDVTNPLRNSINENCARIRAAFLSKFDDHLARNYYITGLRGEPKRITLPRELVRWEE